MRKGQIRYSRGYQPRRHPRRRFKKEISWKKRIFFLLVLFFILGLAYLLFFSPIFEIKAIKISGNQVISSEDVEDSLHNFLFKKLLIFFNRNNIFLARENKIKELIFRDFPRTLSIEVDKNIFERTINLKIIERKEVGIFCKVRDMGEIEDCYYIDKGGVIFEEAPRTSGTLILVIRDYSGDEIKISQNVIEKGFMEELINLKGSLLNQFSLKVLDFVIEPSPLKDLRINTHEGWYILFDKSRDLKNQLDALRLVLEGKIKEGRKNLEYIDLRIENRAYYKSI